MCVSVAHEGSALGLGSCSKYKIDRKKNMNHDH